MAVGKQEAERQTQTLLLALMLAREEEEAHRQQKDLHRGERWGACLQGEEGARWGTAVRAAGDASPEHGPWAATL